MLLLLVSLLNVAVSSAVADFPTACLAVVLLPMKFIMLLLSSLILTMSLLQLPFLHSSFTTFASILAFSGVHVCSRSCCCFHSCCCLRSCCCEQSIYCCHPCCYCCWRYCCCLYHGCCLHPVYGRHFYCCRRPFSSWWFSVAGLPVLEFLVLVGVSAVPFEHVIAGILLLGVFLPLMAFLPLLASLMILTSSF